MFGNADLEPIIARDAGVCAAMADEMAAYVQSDVLFWEPDRHRAGGAALPKLTLGGLLLALRRLDTLHQHLTPDQAHAMARARREMDFHRRNHRRRYGDKLVRDLRSRLDTWAWYLQDCRREGQEAIVYYPRQVETRVKITLLLDEAEQIGVETRVWQERLSRLDKQLRADWVKGDFCWPAPLASGFAPDRFWYLYGRPGG